ncbi:TPA: GmrSD restriction endonuclease domain-containing protein [Enterococcus faecalis]
MSILDMCKYIKRNKITLPLYQRDLSWNVQKSMALLNYQLFGKAPVAPISINQMSTGINAVPQVSFINRELIDSNQIEADHQSVVDGQQRLSTNYKAYTNHEDFRNIFLDVSAAKFKIVDGSIKDYHVPVGVVLNEDDGVLLRHLQEKDLVQELFPILTQVRSKMMSYNYTINIADNLTEDEQIEWFEVLNNAGSRVSALQMSFSKLKLHDFDIYSDYVAPFKEKIQKFGYDELFSPFTTNVSYPVASLNPAFEKVKKNGQHSNNYAPIPSDTKESQITKLTVDDLKKVIELSLGGLDRALSFIQNNDLEEFVDRMDYILYLVGYFIFNDNLDIKTEENLVMWIETIDFSNKSNGERRNIFDKLINNIFDED